MHPNATTWNGFKFNMLNAPRNLVKSIGKEMLKLTDMAVAICNMMAKVLIFCFVLAKIPNTTLRVSSFRPLFHAM